MNGWHTPSAVIWFAVVGIITAVFWFTPLDIVVSGWFYNISTRAWLIQDFPLIKAIFYDGVPYFTALTVLGCLGLMIFGTVKRQYALRLYSLYVVLVFTLGSGVLVNAVFKEHWGRARPATVEQFGGTQPYTPPAEYVANGTGQSFPSGHSSVGFAFIAFWFIWRKRHRTLANGALAVSLGLGCAIGLTRIVAGGHFLSDVLWSAWVMIFAAWVLYYPVLNIPNRENRYLSAKNS